MRDLKAELAPLDRLPIEPNDPNLAEPLIQAANRHSNTPHSSFDHQNWGLVSLFTLETEAVGALGNAYIARIIIDDSSWRFFDVPIIARFLSTIDGPSPDDFMDVAEFENGREWTGLETVSLLAVADPDLWSILDSDGLFESVASKMICLLDTNTDWSQIDRRVPLQLLRRATSLPDVLRSAVIEAAITGYKSDREVLYEVVDDSYLEDVLTYLASKKRQDRLGAAQWLRAHPIEEAADRVRVVARSEKDGIIKAELVASIDLSGADIDEFVSRQARLKDAKAGLAHKNAIPKALSWLGIKDLPSLHWKDGKKVNPAIVQWMLVLAVRANSGVPGPLMAGLVADIEPESATGFGNALFKAWLDQDTAPSSRASTSKGLLSVVARFADTSVTNPSLRYIRQFRRKRPVQVEALLEMLSWQDTAESVNSLSLVAMRIRPQKVQDQAELLLAKLADRLEMDLDDLGDLRVPDGGFDGSGRLSLSYGNRSFTARLGDDLSITLTNDETGKPIRSLPKGRADEDASTISKAKSAYATAKDEVGGITELQSHRLYLALCEQRSWRSVDFSRLFLEHVVLLRLATRLVWTATGTDGTQLYFRPLTDGTLIDCDDGEIEFSTNQTISLAHQSLMSETDATGWFAHLVDYEIDPLFAQFACPKVEASAGQTTVDDFFGYLHSEYTLHVFLDRWEWEYRHLSGQIFVAAATSFARGSTYTPVLRFGRSVYDDYSEEPQFLYCAKQLYFMPNEHPWAGLDAAIELSAVPPVLLAEVYHQAQAMARTSIGHDPDYRQKVQS